MPTNNLEVWKKKKQRQRLLKEKPAWLTGEPYTEKGDTLRFKGEPEKMLYMQRSKKLNAPPDLYKTRLDSIKLEEAFRKEREAPKELERKQKEFEFKQKELKHKEKKFGFEEKEAQRRAVREQQRMKFDELNQLADQRKLFSPSAYQEGDPRQIEAIDARIKELSETLLDVKSVKDIDFSVKNLDWWRNTNRVAQKGVVPKANNLMKYLLQEAKLGNSSARETVSKLFPNEKIEYED